nr:uncharacterized protein LOC116806797 [Taeniopygia guttata]XP_041567259.1 uncharacterized protein LOC116806797 [Taeniopygia guttata]XP_041567260.1 uncharacterized protein LOC116806797 [Taeniopygia guttata]XP_041567261.1 uncharacterized protein LOC116806797 [Taeniopygia guttata]
MDAIARVVSAIHKQWGIGCRLKDFYLAIARLLELGAIERPVDVLHLEIWGKCTAALAEDTKSSGSGKNLKAWGKVEKAPHRAIEEQETWSAARTCLLVTPKLGVGAGTQTAPENDLPGSGDPGGLGASPPSPDQSPVPAAEIPREIAASPPIPPPLPVRNPLLEVQQGAERFWQGLAKEARDAETAARENTLAMPPPYPLENGAGRRGEGRGAGNLGAKTWEPRDFRNAYAQEKEAESGRERGANQQPRRALPPYKGETTPCGRRGEPGGRERRHPQGEERAQSRTKRHRAPEVRWHSTSGSESSSSSASSEELTEAGYDSETEETEPAQFKTKPSRVLSCTEKQLQYEPAQFTDWGKIKIACAEWSPAAAIQVFPVRLADPEGNQQRVYTPINPKDVQSIVKAIAEKGINSAIVSTLIDGLFSNDDLLPFDIERIGRMILGGAGMIVFRQE